SRLYPDCISAGHHRQIVPTVRADHRNLCDLLSVQRALTFTRAVGAVAASAQESSRAARLVLRSLQSRLRQCDAWLRELVASRDSENLSQLRSARCSRRWRGFLWRSTAEQLFAGGRPGVCFYPASIARRVFARAHRPGLSQD